ncbi:MAG: undecaprenyl/decaprenyl-phosphate alpha-N-acetylglucosaminyl 1-phosphate transferase, partial [Erysipelotrichaceae bacterium]|nr:undecaprenyl/decaprenyl-phosphate alpha-N-acetylglucosaminyl 1-phosphate transferase [Erysipelotrichaceae bacterium]
AINLMDGLDGLAAGNSLIMIGVIGVISYFMNRIDISIMCLILAGSIAGFLPYNFHPASVFMGDCGALFLGFTIACYSLLGFKTTAFITLGFPIIILFVPLSDTTLAIIRRKASGHRISEADRSHLHHVLMYKIGLSHRNTVLLLYLVCALFGLDAVLMYFHPFWAWIMLFVLCMVAWIFIELTGMINPNFHPIIGLLRRTIGHPRKSENAFFEANKLVHATADPPKREEENES